MKTVLIVLGIVVFLIIVVFLYLFIVGSDESRRRERKLTKDRLEE